MSPDEKPEGMTYVEWQRRNAPTYVVVVRIGRRVRAYGPARRPTALRFRDAWREKYGKWREARVITLEKMTDEF